LELVKKRYNIIYKYYFLNLLRRIISIFIKFSYSYVKFSSSRDSLQLVNIGQVNIKKAKNQFLIKDFLLGAYALISLNNKIQNSLFLINPHNLYSTKSKSSVKSKYYRPKPSTLVPLSIKKIDKEKAKLKGKAKAKRKEIIKEIDTEEDILFSPETSQNYIEGWESNWLKKLRFIEMLNKYKLDRNDKLLISILKERKYNLNTKMSQEPLAPLSLGTEVSSSKLVQSKNLDSATNYTNLRIINNNKQKNGDSQFSTVGKSRDFLKNQFIQYKFNRSNAKPSVLNKV
jgi:hypothetical protein